MALSRNHYHNYLSLNFVVTAIIFFSLTLLHPDSGGIEASTTTISSSLSSRRDNINDEEVKNKMMILGSKPPACVNKCLSCRPCEATLVIPPHHNIKIKDTIMYSNYEKSSSHSPHNGHSHRGGDGSYYLLSWKCRCGNRLYQP
ncbi:hypothetical protein ACJIZ3_020254 [Penstemon smallii]|uniref:Epidermal patterning factor-like protein n=1 Tax=Penstemon smallii TaxID=265156 RepID=A0ABD3SI30_9LAMI